MGPGFKDITYTRESKGKEHDMEAGYIGVYREYASTVNIRVAKGPPIGLLLRNLNYKLLCHKETCLIAIIW